MAYYYYYYYYYKTVHEVHDRQTYSNNNENSPGTDYCNSLLYGVSDGLLRRLQSLQNATARLMTTGPRRINAAATAMAHSPSVSHLQGRGADSLVTVWNGATVPS